MAEQGTTIQDIVSMLTGIATFVGILTAIYGITAWRREHVGRRRIELAEDALAAFYEAADAIDAIRHPFSSSDETGSIERSESENDAQFNARKNASVVFVRYNAHSELFSKLHAMRYRFMAQIGKEEAEPFNELRRIVNEIIVSARMLSRLWAREHFSTTEQQEKHFKDIERHESVFWAGLSEPDPIATKVTAVVQRFEAICRVVIESGGEKHWLAALSRMKTPGRP